MPYFQKSFNNKYGAIKQEYNGVLYDSKLEASRAYELDMLKHLGEIKGWTRQFPVELYIYNAKGEKIRFKTWKVDFCVENNDGSFTLEEVKGVETDDYRWKRDICEHIWLVDNPEYELVILKQSNIRKTF